MHVLRAKRVFGHTRARDARTRVAVVSTFVIVSTFRWTFRLQADPSRRWPNESVAAHDLEQARVIGQPQRLRRFRDVPVVLLERGEDDLTFGLRLHGFQRPRRGGRIRGLVAIVSAAYLGWNFRGGDHRAV